MSGAVRAVVGAALGLALLLAAWPRGSAPAELEVVDRARRLSYHDITELGHEKAPGECAVGLTPTNCTKPEQADPRSNPILQSLLSNSAVAANGVRYGPKETKNTDTLYQFFAAQPGLYDFLRPDVFQALFDEFGIFTKQTSLDQLVYGKNWYVAFQDEAPFVTVYGVFPKKSSLSMNSSPNMKVRWVLNSNRPTCHAAGNTVLWQFVVQKTKKSTVRKLVKSENFYDCEAFFSRVMEDLIANMTQQEEDTETEPSDYDVKMRAAFENELDRMRGVSRLKRMHMATQPISSPAFMYICAHTCRRSRVQRAAPCTQVYDIFAEYRMGPFKPAFLDEEPKEDALLT